MTVKTHEENSILRIMSDNNHGFLRKAVSDVTNEVSKVGEDLDIDIMEAECDCCGLKEECTKEYISRIRELHSGKWVCGLCSEAVKERLNRKSGPVAIEEAVSRHRDFVEGSRVNPKLLLTWTMRDIVKRSGDKRRFNLSKITRTYSCNPSLT